MCGRKGEFTLMSGEVRDATGKEETGQRMERGRIHASGSYDPDSGGRIYRALYSSLSGIICG